MDTGNRRHWIIFLLLIVLAVLAGCGQSDMTTSDTTTTAPAIVLPTGSNCGWQRIGSEFEPVPPIEEGLQRALAAAGIDGQIAAIQDPEIETCLPAPQVLITLTIRVDDLPNQARLEQITAQLDQIITEVMRRNPDFYARSTGIAFVSPTQQCEWNPSDRSCRPSPRQGTTPETPERGG